MAWKLITTRQKDFSPDQLAIAAAALAALTMSQFQDSVYSREQWLVIGLLVAYAARQRISIKQTEDIP
jgi:hypothetical protein